VQTKHASHNFEVYLENNGPYYKSKLELKLNSSKILPVLIASLSELTSFFFALKVKLKDLKFEYCQLKLEKNHK